MPTLTPSYPLLQIHHNSSKLSLHSLCSEPQALLNLLTFHGVKSNDCVQGPALRCAGKTQEPEAWLASARYMAPAVLFSETELGCNVFFHPKTHCYCLMIKSAWIVSPYQSTRYRIVIHRPPSSTPGSQAAQCHSHDAQTCPVAGSWAIHHRPPEEQLPGERHPFKSLQA